MRALLSHPKQFCTSRHSCSRSAHTRVSASLDGTTPAHLNNKQPGKGKQRPKQRVKQQQQRHKQEQGDSGEQRQPDEQGQTKDVTATSQQPQQVDIRVQQTQQQEQQQRRSNAQRSGPVLRWRSGSAPAAAAPAPAQATATRVAAPPQETPGASATAPPSKSSISDIVSTAATAQRLFTPASPPPGYYKPQTTTATDEEIEQFLIEGINQQYAAPTSLQEQQANYEEALQQQQADIAAAKQRLPPEYQAKLAEAAAAAVSALASARLRAGGLSAELLSIAEGAATVAQMTQSPFTAQVAVSILEDIVAGRQPDPECVASVCDPMLLEAEQFDTVSPEIDHILISKMEGSVPDINIWQLGSEALLQHCQDCDHWESLARCCLVARGTPTLQLAHCLVLLRRLPGLVTPGELGFRAQLRLQEFVGQLLDGIASCQADMQPADIPTVCLAIGRLGAASQSNTGQTRQSNTGQTLTDLVNRHMAALSVRQLADILWGIGKAQVDGIDKIFISRIWSSMLQKSKQTPLDTLSLAKGMFACALLQCRPNNTQLQPFYTACLDHVAAFSPVQISNTVWAIATLELQPPAELLHTLLYQLLHGQIWSADGQTTQVTSSADQRASVQQHDRSGYITTLAAAQTAAATDAAAAAEAHAAALRVQLPATVVQAAGAAQPFLYQWPDEGPLPSKPDTLLYYWQHMLAESTFGKSNNSSSSSVSAGLLPLPKLLPHAPTSLLMLSSVQLLIIVESLNSIYLASKCADIAEMLEEIWTAASALCSGSNTAQQQQQQRFQFETAADIPVAELQRIVMQQQQQQQRRSKQQQGFGSSAKPKQQQQQQLRGGTEHLLQIDSSVLKAFNAATDGLWEVAAAEGWALGQLAAATAMLGGSSSGGNSSSSNTGRHTCVSRSWLAANHAIADFMHAWYAAAAVVIPHSDPVVLARTLVTVAEITSDQPAKGWHCALRRITQTQWQGQTAYTTSRAGQTNAAADVQLQQQQQQQLLLPPLPPASWIAAAVKRLVITRSAYSELALLRVFEALAQILAEHPDRDVLLQQQEQQQQQQQQWWWRTKQLEWEDGDPAAAEDGVLHQQQQPAAAAAMDQGLLSMLRQLKHEAELLYSSNDSSSSSSSSRRRDISSWPTSWLNSGSSSSSSSSSSSVFHDLSIVVQYFGSLLGDQLSVDMMIQAAAAVASVSPQLLDAAWLQQHEQHVARQLQQQGWSKHTTTTATSTPTSTPATASSLKQHKQQKGLAKQQQQQRHQHHIFGGLPHGVGTAMAAGLSPAAATALLQLHARCGYTMGDAALRAVCEQIAAAARGGGV